MKPQNLSFIKMGTIKKERTLSCCKRADGMAGRVCFG
jgi:hypothetical protein